MKARRILFSVFLLLGGGRAWATVDLEPVGQSRWVAAEEHVSGRYDELQRIAAPFWGPFEATARVAWEYPWEPSSSTETREYFATAWQASDLTPQVITASGGAEERGPFYCYGYPLQFASSNFRVDFMLPSSGTWFLSADLYARGDYGGTNNGWYEASIQLSRGTEILFSAEQFGVPPYEDPSALNWPELHLGENLSLAAGMYTLEGYARAHCFYTPDYDLPGCGGGGSATYYASLHEVPVPAAMTLALCGFGFVTFLRRTVLQ